VHIGLHLPDPAMRQALDTLLRRHGHRTSLLPTNGRAPELSILHSPEAGAPAESGATLYLRPATFGQAHPDPRGALEHALHTGGVAVWEAPLDTRALIEALADRAEDPRPQGPRFPLLPAAPFPWLLIDPLTGMLVSEGGPLNGLAERNVESRVPVIPEPLRARLPVDRSGHEAVRIENRSYLALWWTTDQGHRLVLFLPGLRGPAAPAERQRRTLAEIGRMATTLAHEIRGPVASLAGALELLEQVEEPAERAEIIGLARSRLSQLRQLLDETLRLARAVDGPTESVSAQELVKSCQAAVMSEPDLAQLEIDVEAPSETILVEVHMHPVRQALMNLLRNAAQAQGNDGRVHVRLRPMDGQVHIDVQDEGPGVPPASRDRIFEPFYTTKAAGTGLGLAYVRRVVEACGGTVALLDTIHGATFRVTLNRSEAQEPEATP
jgi:signal transduction histidine kinase